MPGDKGWKNELYRGLEFLLQDSFPKECRSCGKVYEKPEDFFSETLSLRETSGLMESVDDDDSTIVGLFRNCTCGTTFMEECKDRRDMSEAGVRRREVFVKLRELLTSVGLDEVTATRELKRVVRGEDSEVLKDYGVDITKLHS